MAQTRCTWCKDPNAEDVTDDLCRTHQAEAEGFTVDQLDRRDAQQHAEWYDAYYG